MNGTTPGILKTWWVVAIALPTLYTLGMVWPGHAPAEIHRYWCPDRVGAEIQAQPGPGCEPLFVEEDEVDKVRRRQGPPLTPNNIVGALNAFLQKYRRFLACCATDLDTTDDIEDLDREASAILRQLSLLPPSVFLSSSQGMIAPVARARHRLQALERRHDDLGERLNKVPTLDYESAGRERLIIEQQEKEIAEEFRSSTSPDTAPTGSSISDSSLNNAARTGTRTGSSVLNRSAASGTRIGNSSVNDLATTGTRTGASSLNNSATVDTDIGASSPINTDTPTGGDISNSDFNATSSSGPAIGNSSLNQR